MGQTTGVALLGAVWATRVFAHAGEIISGGASAASAQAQVSALHDTFVIMTVIIILALVMAIWALVQERRSQPLTSAESTSRQ
jgi:heme/copper-type cytochrome/quinol oxidase subunit 2